MATIHMIQRVVRWEVVPQLLDEYARDGWRLLQAYVSVQHGVEVHYLILTKEASYERPSS